MVNKGSTAALTFRIFLMASAWYGVLGTVGGVLVGVIMGKYALVSLIRSSSPFTFQSNAFVAIWLTIAVLAWRKEKDIWLLQPKVRGALTVYITVTMVIYSLLSNWTPLRELDILNLVTHYIVPAFFILDWVLFETNQTYLWKWTVYWLVYPLGYFIYAMIYTAITGEYLYVFFDIPQIGYDGFLIWIFGLILIFLTLGVGYITVNNILKIITSKE